jgi:hypothetical protein
MGIRVHRAVRSTSRRAWKSFLLLGRFRGLRRAFCLDGARNLTRRPGMQAPQPTHTPRRGYFGQRKSAIESRLELLSVRERGTLPLLHAGSRFGCERSTHLPSMVGEGAKGGSDLTIGQIELMTMTEDHQSHHTLLSRIGPNWHSG